MHKGQFAWNITTIFSYYFEVLQTLIFWISANLAFLFYSMASVQNKGAFKTGSFKVKGSIVSIRVVKNILDLIP